MGLDQYAYSREAEPEPDYYWRKHPNLHGWMEQLWISRGKTEQTEWDSFNGVDVQLLEDDIKELKKAILSGMLPPTDGFFFGDGTYAVKEYLIQDLLFCKWALEEIALGKEVYYDSSW